MNVQSRKRTAREAMIGLRSANSVRGKSTIQPSNRHLKRMLAGKVALKVDGEPSLSTKPRREHNGITYQKAEAETTINA